MRQCILHVGMYKTGTTSIQSTLAASQPVHGWHYLSRNGSVNMSVPMIWMFHSEPNSMRTIRRRGLSPSEVGRHREHSRRRLESFLASPARGIERVLISGEGIVKVDSPGRADLAAFLRRFFNEISVVAYIRPPVGYVSSSFQQRIKGAQLNSFDPDAGWPRYRAQLEDWDLHFGRENVSYWKYEPARFPDGCVVRDFSGRIGLDLPAGSVRRANDSLSCAALGILYAFRKHGPDFGIGAAAIEANTDIVRALQMLRGPKFQFASHVARAVCARHADDLAWIENRLGEPLTEHVGTDTDAVADESDLLRITSADCEAFVAAFEKRTGMAVRVRLPAVLAPDPVSVAELVEICRQAVLQRPDRRLRAAYRQMALRLLR